VRDDAACAGLLAGSRREYSSSFRPAPGYDFLPIAGAHPDQEAVVFFTFSFIGLISSFHFAYSPFSFSKIKRLLRSFLLLYEFLINYNNRVEHCQYFCLFSLVSYPQFYPFP
jgi:hypothetical protein